MTGPRYITDDLENRMVIGDYYEDEDEGWRPEPEDVYRQQELDDV
jgi:hypothetical protein